MNYDLTDLINRVKKKDMLAMKILYNQYAKSMLSISFRITQNRQDSEDILQESFLRSFQQIHTLKTPQYYPAWLKRIVVNNSLNVSKKQRIFEPIEKADHQINEADEHWYKEIPFDKIKTAIRQLPDGCRTVFILYLIEDYKHKEVANMLQISISTSKSQYRYSLKLMKGLLTNSTNK